MHYMKQEATLTLGAEVRRLRQLAGMSQERLAERISTTRETISQIERNLTKRPDDEILEGFEEHIGLTRQRAHELMGAVPSTDLDALFEEIVQIAALPDHESRMERWLELPTAMQKAVHQWAQDLLLDAALQARAASGQKRRQHHRN